MSNYPLGTRINTGFKQPGFCLLFNEGIGTSVSSITDRTVGSITDSSISWITSDKGRALNFAGGSGNYKIDLGTIDSNHSLSFSSSGKCTIFFRARIDTTSSWSNLFPRVIDKSDGGSSANGWSIWAYNVNKKYDFVVNAEGSGYYSPTITDDTWHNVIIKRNGTSWKWFILDDGDTVRTTSGTASASSFPTSSVSCAIGNWNHSSTDRSWLGDLSFIMTWDDALEDDYCELLLKDVDILFNDNSYGPQFFTVAGVTYVNYPGGILLGM